MEAMIVETGADWANAEVVTEAVYTAENAGPSVTGWFPEPDEALAYPPERKTPVVPTAYGPDPTQSGARLVEEVPLHVSKASAPGRIWGINQTQALTVTRRQDRC